MTAISPSVSPLDVRLAQDCRFDQVSIGEVMLRLDPRETRTRTAREFQVWEAGGEFNVGGDCGRCFGLHTAVVTRLG